MTRRAETIHRLPERRPAMQRLRTGRTERYLVAGLLAAALVLLAPGCAPPPPPGTPMDRGDLEELADALSRDIGEIEGLRGSGTGIAKASGRNLRFAFALVYDSPEWLRADVRPEAGSFSSTMTALLLWDEGCARAYLPGRVLDVRGCIAGSAGPLAALDHASVLLGALDPDLIRGLEAATVSGGAGTTLVRGSYEGLDVSIETEGSPPRLTGLRMEDETSRLELVYAGHGWRQFGWFPETVKASLKRDGREALSIDLVYRTARLTDHADRTSFAFDVPSGVTVIGWDELGF